jgi:D-arabinose 1-dehydrogenase-like Zn-dependent alcohol dehydrogenase
MPTKINYIHTTGKCDITEYDDVDLPDINQNQILIRTLLCGICRGDIYGYGGYEGIIPFLHQGHEGLGEVVQIGSNISDVNVGDLVATYASDPAFATYFISDKDRYVKVPEVLPKYILEPTACSINIALKTIEAAKRLNGVSNPNILLLGSGFMSLVIGQYFKAANITFDIVGRANNPHWDKLDIQMKTIDDVKFIQYDAIIDLTSKTEVWDMIPELNILKPEGILCYASTPVNPVTTNFFQQSWNCYNIILPSPRNSDFYNVMKLTAKLIKKGDIDPSDYWTHSYDRNNMTQVKQGFEDGLNRSPKYIRGYFVF